MVVVTYVKLGSRTTLVGRQYTLNSFDSVQVGWSTPLSVYVKSQLIIPTSLLVTVFNFIE
jgi:hypothetical protein